jgi:CSN8/PSMD8/EIF3K family
VISDLRGARFLWRRLPTSAREEADVATAWSLGQALWRGDRPQFYSTAAAHPWTATHAPLVARLVSRVRDDAFALISRAYSAIAADKAAAMLGLTVDNAVTECAKAGWTRDGAFLLPVRSAPGSKIRAAQNATARNAASTSGQTESNPSLVALSSLTEQLVRLQGC